MALDCTSLLLLSKTQQLTNTARAVGQIEVRVAAVSVWVVVPEL